ncbi:MAG: biosynthetic-type acetolactate synthase large subunit [Planctomycetia bacterium]|nr:biosynthetic-type acetolactate synthase large subunit [Planctomycetia bacterium]
MSGTDIIAQMLIRSGVSVVFAYPGAVTMPLHQTLTRYRDKIRVILPRHEQGGGFAAQGYARATGKLGVCMATSGPGATNLITSIADAKLDSIPLLAITGQVNTGTIGSDGFQETPMTEVCRSITKHHCLITDVKDIVRVMKEAIYIATTGRPGPVLIDLPKDVLVSQCYPDFDAEMNLPGYCAEAPDPDPKTLSQIAECIGEAARPVLLIGGGVITADASEEIRSFAEKTGFPVAKTLPALAAFPTDHPLSLGMIGMHGTVYANRAVYHSDLLLACGVRFSDRITGKVSEFAKSAKVIHIDIDPAEINKVKKANIPLIADLKKVFQKINGLLENKVKKDLNPWYQSIEEWKKEFPLAYDHHSPYILPEAAIEELWKKAKDRNVIIATGVGQHQMWTAQFYHFSKPRTWISSCGLGTMGFGLPAAMGVKVACPDRIVVDVDGDGSFQMNIQEMATCCTEKIPVKVMLMNNQHLGMVMQWEDRFHGANRGNTYLGFIDDPEAQGNGDGITPKVRYPDYPGIARSYGWKSRSVSKKEELSDAICEMLDADGPFLLEVNVPYGEHVLPMTPPGGSVENIITK